MPEVTRAATHAEHEIVILQRSLPQNDLASREIDGRRFFQQNTDVLTIGENGANGLRDFWHRQSRRGHLIKQWLEQVMIVAIHDRDPCIWMLELVTERKSAKAAPNHHDMRQLVLHARCFAARRENAIGSWVASVCCR